MRKSLAAAARSSKRGGPMPAETPGPNRQNGAGASVTVRVAIGGMELTLGVIVSVDEQPAVVGEVDTELDEDGSKVPVQAVEVVIARTFCLESASCLRPARMAARFRNPLRAPARGDLS